MNPEESSDDRHYRPGQQLPLPRNEFLFRRRHPNGKHGLFGLIMKTTLRILKWRVEPGWGLRTFLQGLILDKKSQSLMAVQLL